MPRSLEDLTGQLLGGRRVLRQAKPRIYGGCRVAYWRCTCLQCGHESDVQGSSLRRGVGCPHCAREAQRGPHQQPPERNRTIKIRQKQLTVGGLQKLLEKLPSNMPVRIYLMGDKGWATVELRTVEMTNTQTLLAAQLPDRLERWPTTGEKR